MKDAIRLHHRICRLQHLGNLTCMQIFVLAPLNLNIFQLYGSSIILLAIMII